jgi:two-component system, NtrC family, response regulator
MGRLDVRVRTKLQARVEYNSRDKKAEETVTITEISLSGALVSDLSTELTELFTVRATLPGTGEIELQSKIVRPARGGTSIRLFFSDGNTMQALWGHIRSRLTPDDDCPYCGHKEPKAWRCEKCNMYLNFTSEDYLERHVENTFAQRLHIRLSRLKLEHIQKIIQFVDSRILKIQHRSPDREFIGTSPAMLAVFSMIRKVAPTEMNVLILGESGTGKELTAKALQKMSARKDGPFVAVNCAAIPESLLEAELFGYEKGSFTGACATRKGKFESADCGTLFLDEIGDLPPNLQAKLLRFLEDRIVERIGSSSSRKVDVRIIAATNCDLQKSMENSKFRPDLFYRLNSFTIKLPSLRDRGEDRILLARHFLKNMGLNEAGPKDFSEEAFGAIRQHSWPGNVRELHNKVGRGFLMATGELIDPACMELDRQDIVFHIPDANSKGTELRREIVAEVLERNNYVIAKAARELNISRPTLYVLMRKYGVSVPMKKDVKSLQLLPSVQKGWHPLIRENVLSQE